MRIFVGLSVAALLAGSACASGGGSAPDESVSAAKFGADIGSSSDTAAPVTISGAADFSKDLALLANQELIRPANFYKLERIYEPVACEAALKSLNRPYAVPEDLRTWRGLDGMPAGPRDTASHQAAYYLGTNDNVRWSWRTIAGNEDSMPKQQEEMAFIGLDDETRLVIRIRSMLASRNLVKLGIRAAIPPGRNFEYLIVVGAGTGKHDLPDTNNLSQKLAFSVADLIRIGERYYPLIMPLREYDDSGRVYVTNLRADTPRPEQRRWHADIICTLTPRG